MFRLLNEDGDIEIIENRPRIQYDSDLSKDGAIYDINEYYQTKRHYNIYKMDKELLEKEKEIERLNKILEDIDTYIHLWKLEEIGEKTMLILNDILLIKNGMSDKVIRLKGEDKE